MARLKLAERCVVSEADEALWTALQALADPVRLRIVRLLREREQCVCHLTEELGLSQPTVSHHMGLLKRAKLVLDRRDARWTYYRLAPEAATRLSAAIADLLDVSQMDPTPAGCHTPALECGRPASQASAEASVPTSRPAQGSRSELAELTEPIPRLRIRQLN